jgi:hypothetical protein
MSLRRRTPILASSAALLAMIAGTFVVEDAVASHGKSPIKPHQHFTATVNGSSGQPNPVTIGMACFGPIQPGQTGHPFAGQTVGVSRAPASNPNAGYTGDRGTSIGAFFGAPPPSTPTPTSSSYVRFTRYGTKPIPTSLELPCAGSGQVTFVPLPLIPGSRDVVVPVRFVGQP